VCEEHSKRARHDRGDDRFGAPQGESKSEIRDQVTQDREPCVGDDAGPREPRARDGSPATCRRGPVEGAWARPSRMRSAGRHERRRRVESQIGCSTSVESAVRITALDDRMMLRGRPFAVGCEASSGSERWVRRRLGFGWVGLRGSRANRGATGRLGSHVWQFGRDERVRARQKSGQQGRHWFHGTVSTAAVRSHRLDEGTTPCRDECPSGRVSNEAGRVSRPRASVLRGARSRPTMERSCG
jgi:hypothetical protein